MHMEQKEVIKSILQASNYVEVFTNLKDWQTTYKTYAKLIHPDICKESDCDEAIRKLNHFKDEIDTGKKHKDDAGEVIYKPFSFIITGDKDLLKKSYDNYKILMSYTDSSSKHFQKYLPETAKIISDTKIEYTFYDRAIPLSSIQEDLPHEHTNWICNRMLEFSAWLSEKGYVHCGINPESVYIMPGNHGAVFTSFYHMTKINEKLTTVSSRFKNFYPNKIFTSKTAIPSIDSDLAKRTTIYMLGDKSGSGVKLRKTHNVEILSFYQKSSDNVYKSMIEHKDLLKKNFETKYHILNK